MFKKNRIILSVFCLLFIVLFFSMAYLPKNYVIPIMMYHSVNPQTNSIMKALIVSPEAFERQVRFLRDNHYNVLPLESLVEYIGKEKKLPPKAVVLTFDDGYKDFYKYAFPVLKKYGVPATMFIIVNEVGDPDRLSWNEIKEMQDSGLVTFGSHSIGADPLINIKSEGELRRQIFDSKKILENKLGRPVNTFSYPEGFLDKHIRELVVEAGYKLAVSTKTGRCFPRNDLFALKRVRISESSSNLINLWTKLSGYQAFFKDNKKCR